MDIRRRIRSKTGIAAYTLRQLAEALRRKHRYLTGSTIVLIGFSGHSDFYAKAACEEILASLRRFGAHIKLIGTDARDYPDFRAELARALEDADAALIDTDSKFFKALRPKELRALGIDIAIPTSLLA